MFFDHYPYTNFHNVNLDWVLQAVKAWGATVEANDQAFQDLEEANESFMSYVTNYLQNLDVQDEINTKLDQLLADGILTPYFAPYVKGYVESWLAANVTPTTPALDETLTLDNAAALSSATGERIARAAFLRTLDAPDLYKMLNKNLIIPGYRIQSACYAGGYFYVCGGSEAADGTGFIAKMTDLDFKDAEISYIEGLGHANDITYSYSDHYLYVTTVGEGTDWGILKINPNDYTDKTLITNCPTNTIGIQYVGGWVYILAPYHIYRTNDFQTYTLVIENTNDILNKFGIQSTNRISQTLVRVPDSIFGWVGSFIKEPEHTWYGFIVYFGSHGAITFDLFPTYNAECQAGVWDESNTIYILNNGTTSPAYSVLKTDAGDLKYELLGSGKDLNDFTGEGVYYLIGSAEMDNCPVSSEGLTLRVGPQGLLNTRQDIYTNSGRHLYRIKLFNPGTWSEWEEPAAEVAQIKEDLSDLYSEAVYQYSGAGKTGLFVTPSGIWGSSSIASTLVFRIPKGTKSIKVDAKTDQTATIAFLRTYAPVQRETVDFAVEYPERITIPEGESAEFDVYADTVYMYILVKDTSSIYHTPTLTFAYADLPLAPLDDTSDRSDEINLLLELFGKCTLAKGTYYVTGIVMPASTVLTGKDSSIILTDTVTEGATIKMNTHCTLSGLDVSGGLTSRPTTEGTRHGIEWTGEDVFTGFIDKCVIHGFDGSGIYLHDSTTKTYRNLLASNCRIYACYVGVDFNKNTEFNGVSNCTITSNYYGIRNRGGNNRVDCCGIDANFCGVLVDADAGSNNGHGSISNCSINHSNSNTGYGIIIRDTGRMVVTGCNLYYSKILLENTNGNIINGCGFGNSAGWEITGGECNVFANCMIRSTSDTPITITNNTQTKVVNCYTRDGAEVTV